MTTQHESDPIARAVEVAVYAPIGAAAYLLEVAPDFIRMVTARGRAEVDVVQEQIAVGVKHAKGAGEVAIAFGLPLVRRKVGERISTLRPPAPPAAPVPAPQADQAPEPTRDSPSATVPVAETITATPAATTNGHHAARADELVDERLAIPGYDALSASQVVERLAGLSGDELAAVRRYETGHRRRRTILGKIEQLST
jgi:hypothetical protein